MQVTDLYWNPVGYCGHVLTWRAGTIRFVYMTLTNLWHGARRLTGRTARHAAARQDARPGLGLILFAVLAALAGLLCAAAAAQHTAPVFSGVQVTYTAGQFSATDGGW